MCNTMYPCEVATGVKTVQEIITIQINGNHQTNYDSA